MNLQVVAPGRVNLIGDHTDYTGGSVMPLAIDRYTVINGVVGGPRVQLSSTAERQPLDLPLDLTHPEAVTPLWAKYVAGVIAEMSNPSGFRGTVSSTIPIGAGLSSSAALEVAAALALGFDGPALELAQLCQRAENRATGLPSGIMDQLTITSGVAGHALLIDCSSLIVSPVALPADVEVVVRFVTQRRLVGSAYADRVAECALAEREVGPLRLATVDEVNTIDDPIIRARALHVVTENRRVIEFAGALSAGDIDEAGQLMLASHNSLRDLYETSTPAMDNAVARLQETPGVYGARMTGGGFGGCVVALTQPGALQNGWVVTAVDGASVSVDS
ncbi:MAG: galactokinase [Actinobacteria bacterium]|nr:galactokinase [Actinomycetota bacterium]